MKKKVYVVSTNLEDWPWQTIGSFVLAVFEKEADATAYVTRDPQGIGGHYIIEEWEVG